MLFNSLEFIFFFPVVTTLYFLLPFRFRWMWLLAASCFFYMAFVPVYILILAFTIVIDYFAGIFIEKASGPRRKLFLSWSIVANVGVLAVFKYFNFFADNANALLHGLNISTHSLPYLQILLPIGLSFHTLQAMSYTIEVYRGRQQAERHFGLYALYVIFFPQLVAGPIERPQNMLPQFREKKYLLPENLYFGLRLMLWGMFKKVVIADNLSPFVDKVFGNPAEFYGFSVLLAVIYFSIQIYCDFSGYSDIAIGSARIMGFRLMTNFRMPFFATSISDFWRRWHISLSTWLRDYLYIPLGGNRLGKFRQCLNLMIVFVISGLWHGASWNFVIWGALHGLFLVTGLLTAPWKQSFNTLTGLSRNRVATQFVDSVTVLSLVIFARIFFRAADFSTAIVLIRNMTIWYGDIREILQRAEFLKILLPCMILFWVEYIWYNNRYGWYLRLPVWTRFATYYALICCIFLLGNFRDVPFIYFQF